MELSVSFAPPGTRVSLRRVPLSARRMGASSIECRESQESTSYSGYCSSSVLAGMQSSESARLGRRKESTSFFENENRFNFRRHLVSGPQNRNSVISCGIRTTNVVISNGNRYMQNFHHHLRKDSPFRLIPQDLEHNPFIYSSFPPLGFSSSFNLARPSAIDLGHWWKIKAARSLFPRNSNYHPPQRAGVVHCYEWCKDTGIASEQDWGISLKSQPVTESGVNDDGSSWYRESGEDVGENGYRCRWTVMGGRNIDGSVEWKETWWEKSDWSGYKELGAEKSGRNAESDTWWETWQESYRQDDTGIPRIEKSAHKQAKSGKEGIWNEKWWEKYNAKGWTDKGAHKYGRLSDQSWWEKWGEQYDGQGSVVKWTDKWAENDAGAKWGDKWEERFNQGSGNRQGETWNISPSGERWSRFWGEEHYGNGQVHKYGKSTSGELWDETLQESTYYEAEPHYGWNNALSNSSQLLAIEIREQEKGVQETENGAISVSKHKPLPLNDEDNHSVL